MAYTSTVFSLTPYFWILKCILHNLVKDKKILVSIQTDNNLS